MLLKKYSVLVDLSCNVSIIMLHQKLRRKLDLHWITLSYFATFCPTVSLMLLFTNNTMCTAISISCHVSKISLNKIADLQKLYASPHLDPERGPRELQNKVMFDVRYCFCCRRGENIESMTKKNPSSYTMTLTPRSSMSRKYRMKWRRTRRRMIKK